MFKDYIQGTTFESIEEVKLVHSSPLLQQPAQKLARKRTNIFFLHRDIVAGWVYRLFKCSRISLWLVC